MLRFLCFCAFLVLCRGYAVPVAPVHSIAAAAPLAVPYISHGYGHGNGFGHGIGHAFGHGLGYGFIPKPLHHVLKRSPHLVEQFAHGGHFGAPIATHLAVSPVAVSHQARVDVHSTPAIVSPIVPVVKQVVTPLVHPAPILHNSFGHYGAGGYGFFHPHGGHY